MRRSTLAITILLAVPFFASHAAASYCEHPEDPDMPQEVECVKGPEEPKDPDRLLGMPTGAGWAMGGLAAAGVAGLAFSLRSLWPAPMKLAIGSLFARLTRRDVTDHPLRARILAAVAQRPGISAVELAVQENLNVGTLDYHLDVLERDGQLRATKAGRNRLLFLPGSGVDVERVAQVSAPGRGDVARTIMQEPGLHAAALAERLGLSRATVHHHISRLEASGLIRVERGLRARCYPTDHLPQALEPVRKRRLAVLSDPNRRNADLAT